MAKKNLKKNKLAIIRLWDSDITDCYLVEFSCSNKKLDNALDKAINFAQQKIEDWNYDDVIDRLEAKGVAKRVPAYYTEAYA